MPSGPVRNDIYTIRFLEGRLYMAHGGHNNYFENALINDGVSIKKEYDIWDNNDYFDLGNARDIVGVAVKNGVEHYASWYNGILTQEQRLWLYRSLWIFKYEWRFRHRLLFKQ